ncbi:hypothetical protein L9F63_020429 [Diploptera punctata]|uniref:Chemosensory protein n=1 Tax=Diploptera punctata TaxID=6984 RepID=A0AAD7ZSL5_DIPPU|nr:hypothetical protein L9F63_020429 [Diploptera punctata]
MQRRVAVVVLLAALVLADKYDNIDIESILRSDRLMNNYMKCFLDTGPCTSQAYDLKRDFPEAMSDCSSCTDEQKKLVKKASRYLIKERPEQWKMILDKYDPDRTRSVKFNKFLNEE